MSITSMIGLIAASFTVLVFIYMSYKYIKKTINNISFRIEEIESSFQTKQKFIIEKGTKVILADNFKIIQLKEEEEVIVDGIEDGFIVGKIFHNSVKVKLYIFDLGEEI